MAVLLTQRPTISEDDVDFVAIDYTKYLDSDELLTGTVTVTELGKLDSFDSDNEPVYTSSSDLTFSNKSVSAVDLLILGKRVAAGKAVQFRVAGQQAYFTYGIRVTVSTDSVPARTKVVDILLRAT